MDNKTDKIAKEVIEHAEQAREIFKTSDELRKAEKEGSIDQGVAANAISELNNQGLAEAEKVIELQKELLAKKEGE